MLTITPPELSAWLADASRGRPVLLDVREPWEWEVCHLPESVHIPMRTIHARLAELDPSRPTVVVCHHGGRSAQVARFLEHQGFAEVFNLSGGVNGWANSVDPHMARY